VILLFSASSIPFVYEAFPLRPPRPAQRAGPAPPAPGGTTDDPPRPAPPPDPRSLPPALDIVTAGRLLGIGRTTAYQLARHDRFPVPVLRIGGGYKVPTAPLLALLGIDTPTGTAARNTAAA
jgi:hypothetical protein